MAMISPIGSTSHGSVVQVNEALCRMLGRSEAELVGADLLDHVHPEDRAAALADCAKERYAAERRYLRSDGSVRWLGVSSIDVQPIDGQPGYRLVHTVDITATKSREQRLEHDARHDPLTGLANRRALGEALDDRRIRAGGSALLFCDLDDFKLVNDRYGHDVGDRVLVEVGRRLQATARGADVVARLGGDEFVVLGRELDHISAVRLAHRLSTAVGRPMTDIVPGLTISCTVGVAVGGPGDDTADLLARADRQLLESKRSTSSGQARGRPRAR
jgi:diguanylate cyclase (GGDEF)-like protein/PAS domain S-box-containing protein